MTSTEAGKPATAARIYDYFLGGTHNFPADRAVAQELLKAAPWVPAVARANRGFLRRAVRHMSDSGVRQFLDLGSGIPTAGNVHEIAPQARVAYVDTDPVAVAESLEILQNNDRVTALKADLTNPDEVLGHPEIQRLISFDEPVGLLIVAVLHFVPDDTLAYPAVDRYVSALPPGSFLAISHGSVPEGAQIDDLAQTAQSVYRTRTATPVFGRTNAGVERFFGDLNLLEPGLVWAPQWRPEPGDPTDFAENPAECLVLAGVGRRM